MLKEALLKIFNLIEIKTAKLESNKAPAQFVARLSEIN